MDDQDFETLARRLRDSFEAQVPYQIARASRIKAIEFMPAHYFSRASFECKDMFVAGCYVGCVSLCQSVAEALARLLCISNSIKANNVLDRAAKLEKHSVITREVREAFRTIYAHDRNIFHHLDESIETDERSLGARAEQCVSALYRIESEIFAYSRRDDGGIVPKYPEYWWPARPDSVSAPPREQD